MRIDYFQLIDRIVALDTTARTISVEAQVPQSHSIFEGHFPGFPTLPGVLLIEAMAQTSGWLLIALTQFQRMPFLAAVKNAKLRRFIAPGERVLLTAELEHEGSGYSVTHAQGKVDGELACGAQITFRLIDFPHPELRDHMEAMAQRLSFPNGASANG